MSQESDHRAFAAETRRSTTPVSAFFLIDSAEAIDRCVGQLARFAPHGMPDLTDTPYVRLLREIVVTGREALNVDHRLTLGWNGEELPALIRFHSVDRGRYEVELWLPGVIANDMAAAFGDGRTAFFCGFMPPSFYD
jgi:hypothetical protein